MRYYVQKIDLWETVYTLRDGVQRKPQTVKKTQKSKETMVEARQTKPR